MDLTMTDPQKSVLQKLLRSRKSLMPHEISTMLHIKRSEAIAILKNLMEQHPDKINHKTLVYCNCGIDSNAPASAAIAYTETKPKTVKCDLCEEEVEIDESTGYDEIFILKSPIYSL